MMVLETEQDHAERKRCLAMIHNPKSNCGSQATRRLAQFLKSRAVSLTFMESKFKSPAHLEIIPIPRWSNPEASTATWTSYDTTIQICSQIPFPTILVSVCRSSVVHLLSFVTDLVCTLDHSTNGSALAQVLERRQKYAFIYTVMSVQTVVRQVSVGDPSTW